MSDSVTTDELEEEAEIAQDRLIAELWKRGYIDLMDDRPSHSECERRIEEIEDIEDRNALLDRYETMQDATSRLSKRMMIERGTFVGFDQ